MNHQNTAPPPFILYRKAHKDCLSEKKKRGPSDNITVYPAVYKENIFIERSKDARANIRTGGTGIYEKYIAALSQYLMK